MKRLFLLLGIALVTTLAAGSQLFNHDEHGYTLSVPENWEIKPAMLGSDFVALEPKTDENDLYQENLNVMVENLPKKMDLENYYSMGLRNLEKMLTNFQLENAGDIKLNDNIDAKWMVYTFTIGALEAKILQFIVLNDEGMMAYIITFSAHPDTFDEREEQFRAIADSFSLQD